MTTKRTEPRCRRCGQTGHNKSRCRASAPTPPTAPPQVVPASVGWTAPPKTYPMPPLSRDAVTLEAVAMMLDQLLEAVELVARHGAVSAECVRAVLVHGGDLHKWQVGRLPDSVARAAHTTMWRLIEQSKDHAWLESVALEMLDRHCATTLIWMAFRVSGYITGRDSGIGAPVWVRMYHASILARFGATSKPAAGEAP